MKLKSNHKAIKLIELTSIPTCVSPNEEIEIETKVRGLKKGKFTLTWALNVPSEYLWENEIEQVEAFRVTQEVHVIQGRDFADMMCSSNSKAGTSFEMSRRASFLFGS